MRNFSQASPVDVNHPATIGAAVVLGTIGVLSFIVQPGLVQGFVVELGMTEVQANELAFIEMLGLAIATYAVALGGRLVNWHLLVAASLLLGALGNLGSALAGATEAIGMARFITGIGEGGIISLSFSVIGMTTRTERNLAIYLVVLLTYGAFGLWAMPSAFETVGLQGVFLIWAVLTLASLGTLKYLPVSSGDAKQERVTVRRHGFFMVVVAMLALLVFNSAIGMAWANLFLIGMEIYQQEQAIANALLVSQFVAIGGAMTAMLLELRLRRWLPVALGILGCGGAMALLLGDATYAAFILAVCGFNFLWNMVLPFVLGVVRDMRERSDLMSYSIAMQMTGLGFGPFIAARILDMGGGFQQVLLTTITMLVASFFILAVPMRVHDRLPAPPG